MFIDIKQPLNSTHTAETLGGKGFGLMKMASAGIEVPPALILSTNWCNNYKKEPGNVVALLKNQLPSIREHFVAQFGYMPLLSVRSGARVSMPGMMDTILNVGLTEDNLKEWGARVGKACAYDSYSRLVEMYGSVVHGIPRSEFHKLTLTERQAHYKLSTGEDFPDADGQIIGSILAVFSSWDNERAQIYRKMNNIPEDWGTAVVLQAMVFGNFNDKSCTGVLFTRNPDTGEPGMVGEYLVNAQGEDVVAGTATPKSIKLMKKEIPSTYSQLIAVCSKLESLNKDVQDIEFTVQDGKLFILQTRNAKRSAFAAVRIASDLVAEKLITQEESFKRVTVRTLDLATQKVLDPKFKDKPDYVGLPACSGIAIGRVVKSSAEAVKYKGKCILVSKETTPDDIEGMAAALGVLTMTGGATSHAAVVARGMNRTCIVGLGLDLGIFKEGSTISIDGATGAVWLKEVPTVDGSKSPVVTAFKERVRAAACEGRMLALSDEIKGHGHITLLDLFPQPVEAVKTILKAAAKNSESLLIDFNLPGGKEYAEFFHPFRETLSQWETAVAVWLDAEQFPNVFCLGAPTLSPTLQKVANSENLESLVDATGLVVYSANVSPAAKKILNWKKKDGEQLCLVRIGTVSKSGEARDYLSESQALHLLLK